MKAYPVLITQMALTDVSDIFKYIAVDLHEPAVASKMLNDILSCIDSLEQLPTRNKVVDDEPYHTHGIRKTIVKNYFVLYHIVDDHVVILRVIYNRRDWQNIL